MKAPVFAALLSLISSGPTLAGTFVYVSNAEDGDIGLYTLQADGSLKPGQRFKAAKLEQAAHLYGEAASAIYLSWKLCSGMAHGDFWPTWGAMQRVELPGAPKGTGTFKIEADVKLLMYVTAFAVNLTRQAGSCTTSAASRRPDSHSAGTSPASPARA